MQPSIISTFDSKKMSNCYGEYPHNPQIPVHYSHHNFYRNSFLHNEEKIINPLQTTIKIKNEQNSPTDLQMFCVKPTDTINQNLKSKPDYNLNNPKKSNLNKRILFINHINIQKVKAFHLLNLFSCFGNVKKVLVDKTKRYGFVVMTNEQQAKETFGILNNFHFFGKELRIKFSEFASFSIRAYKIATNNSVDYLYGKPAWYNFKDFLPYKLILPNKILKIEKFPKSLTTPLMQELLRPFHETANIIMIEDSVTKENVMIVEFTNPFYSAEILSIFQRQRINESCLQFSFWENANGSYPTPQVF